MDGDAAPTLPGIGHNRPPDDPIVRAEELLAGFERMPEKIEDEELAGMAVTFAKQLGGCAKKIEDRRKAEKQPHLDAGRAVDQRWSGWKDKLDVAKKTVTKRIDAFKRAREAAARQAEEEARRAAEEAAESAPDNASEPVQPAMPLAAPEAAPIRDDFGALAHDRKVTKHEIENFTKVIAWARQHHEDELRIYLGHIVAKALKSLPEDQAIPGVRTWTETATVVR